MAIRVDKAALREAAKQIRGWDTSVTGARTTTDGTISTYNSVAKPVFPEAGVAHDSINTALATAKTTWAEAFRLTSRDLTLLAKILDVGANHFDLRDDELSNLVNNQG